MCKMYISKNLVFQRKELFDFSWFTYAGLYFLISFLVFYGVSAYYYMTSGKITQEITADINWEDDKGKAVPCTNPVIFPCYMRGNVPAKVSVEGELEVVFVTLDGAKHTSGNEEEYLSNLSSYILCVPENPSSSGKINILRDDGRSISYQIQWNEDKCLIKKNIGWDFFLYPIIWKEVFGAFLGVS